MNEKKREQLKFSDIAPLLLAAAALVMGLGLGKTRGDIWFKLAGALLLCGALAVRHLYARRLGLGLLIGVCGAYVGLAAGLNWASPEHMLVFVAAAVALDLLINPIGKGYEALRRERDFQRQAQERGALVDEGSQLRNLRSYLNDAAIYIRIAKRHHLYLGLVLWRLDNACELRERLGERDFAKLVRRISRQLRSSIRFEDMIFLLDDAPESLTWGTLHIANDAKVCDIVARRLRVKLVKLTAQEGLELAFSTRDALADNDEGVTPLLLLDNAREKFKEAE